MQFLVTQVTAERKGYEKIVTCSFSFWFLSIFMKIKIAIYVLCAVTI